MHPRFLDFDISSRWAASFTLRPPYPSERFAAPIEQEAGWAPEPVWTISRREISLLFRDSHFDSSGVQPLASLYTD
jgi:hypothetical protein